VNRIINITSELRITLVMTRPDGGSSEGKKAAIQCKIETTFELVGHMKGSCNHKDVIRVWRRPHISTIQPRKAGRETDFVRPSNRGKDALKKVASAYIGRVEASALEADFEIEADSFIRFQRNEKVQFRNRN
jgi:hypothetical protein